MAFDDVYIKNVLVNLPESPGVYQYFNAQGSIIYIGKAKNLKKRVSSYFTKTHLDAKTKVLVRQIADIKYTLVDSESDALLLENNLIKKYRPRYNILLKDDKSFPWMKITNETFPRVYTTRHLQRDGGSYYGPYTSIETVNLLRSLVGELFPLRTCSLNLEPANVAASKYKVCLQYHIKNCNGPCVGEEKEDVYMQYIQAIRNILKGNVAVVLQYLKEEMMREASLLNFERAQVLKDKLVLLQKFQSKSIIVSTSISNVDVFSVVEDDKSAYVYFLKVVNGCIVQSHAVEVKKRMDENLEDVLTLVIVDVYTKFESDSKEILVPIPLHLHWNSIRFVVPKTGDKRTLLDLATRNATYHRLEKLKQNSVVKREVNRNVVLANLHNALQLRNYPDHIECFDNSNIQGHYPVAACVVFKNGIPSKNDYRHFNIKTVEGPNDFASMEEILTRRYSRLIDEDGPMPKLIVVDGGKGQLSSAYEVLERLGLENKIDIIGLAKREEEVFLPFSSDPIVLGRDTEELRLLQHLRNEAHRFGITFHRDQRSRGFVESELDAIDGVGEATKAKLISIFKSVKGVREASFEELEQVVGAYKARLLCDYFSKKAEE